jgi:hypothetical protein
MGQRRLLIEFKRPVTDVRGRSYRVLALGAQTRDGLWEGWLEFIPDTGLGWLSTLRETTQPNLVDAEYWASGLEPVYLEGALERALALERGQIVRPRRRPPSDTR